MRWGYKTSGLVQSEEYKIESLDGRKRNIQNRNRLTDRENRLVVLGAAVGGRVGVGRRGGRGMDWELGVGRCKLFHLEWVSKEVLLYSTGNCVQSLGIDHDTG